MISRRRLFAISAAAALLPAASARPATRIWTGQALGARASIRLDHPDARTIAADVLAEIDRLENILSLYRPDSALSRLNLNAGLEAPPFELLECLSVCNAVHLASKGLFDPTVQPLWRLWAGAAAQGRRPDSAEIRRAQGLTGWQRVVFDSDRIAMRPGMAITLNGVGQGYVADRIAALLEARGLTNILIDTGEIRALGQRPDGGTWPVHLENGMTVPLRQRALATSSPLGTCFDPDGRDGHILNPATGMPARAIWRSVTVSSHSAAVADALTTAACLTADQGQLQSLLAGFGDATIEAAERV